MSQDFPPSEPKTASMKRWRSPTGPALARRFGSATAVLGVFVAAVVLLAAIAPVSGSIHHVAVLPGTLPLRVADATVPVAVLSVTIRRARLYATAIPTAVLGAAVGVALARPRARVLAVTAGLAVCAAATVTVLTGCHCGSGTAAPLGWKALASLV